MRNFFVLLLLLIVSMSALTQEADEQTADSEQETETELAADAEDSTEDDAEEPVPEFDETGLDEQGFSNEDDDFNPSEDIPADQSIEFPADI